MHRFVFIDTEATGLDHSRHQLTEVSWIVRFEDGSEATRQYFPDHTVDGAEPTALELTHYDERIVDQPRTPASVWLRQFLDDADGAFLVGAVPDFDAQHLALMCRRLELEPSWDHHLIDVETLALPLIAASPEGPRSLARTCRALGLDHDDDQAHGALYDAQQAMAVFDEVWARLTQLRADNAPLPPAVPRGPRKADRAVVELEAVTDDNWEAVADVSPRDDQRRFVAPLAAYYLLLSAREGVWTSLAITFEGHVVGHVMYAFEDGIGWIGGLVIEAARQRRGIAEAAVAGLIDRLDTSEVRITVHPDNRGAARLWTSAGFQPTDERDGEEVVWARLGPDTTTEADGTEPSHA